MKYIVFSGEGNVVYVGENVTEAQSHFESKVGNIIVEREELDSNELVSMMHAALYGIPIEGARTYHEPSIEALFNEARERFAQTLSELGITKENTIKVLDLTADAVERIDKTLQDYGKKGLRVAAAGLSVMAQTLEKLSEGE